MRARPMRFDRVGRGLQQGVEGLAGAVLFILMLLTTVDVTGRYFFNAPILGAVELTQLLLAVIVFLAFPTVTWREEHITVDLLDAVFPKPLVWLRQLVINAICATALLIMARRIWLLAERALGWGDATEFLRIPLGYLIAMMAIMTVIAGLLCALRALLYLLQGLNLLPRTAPSGEVPGYD